MGWRKKEGAIANGVRRAVSIETDSPRSPHGKWQLIYCCVSIYCFHLVGDGGVRGDYSVWNFVFDVAPRFHAKKISETTIPSLRDLMNRQKSRHSDPGLSVESFVADDNLSHLPVLDPGY